MPLRTISGDESIAYGACLSGVRVAASYPGSPSSRCMDKLFSLAASVDMHVEWSANEKVALETAVGASMGGVPALMACKGVGFNVALDPIMVANLTDVGAGLVILLGDDPGAWASQNDQDTRPIAAGTELPMMEPATPAEGVQMTMSAFKLSREMQMPVIVRITKSFGAMEQDVVIEDLKAPAPLEAHPFEREPMRWISVPTNAVSRHRRQHERVDAITEQFETVSFNQASGSGRYGIIASGFTHTKLGEVLGKAVTEHFRILKLGIVNPIPPRLIADFLASVEMVLVLEENEPFVEAYIKRIAYDAGLSTPIHGKFNHVVAREGELFRWQISEALSAYCKEWTPISEFRPEDEVKHMPSLSGLPQDCPYTPVFQILRELSSDLGLEPVFVVDPGCAIKMNTAPFDMLDVKYSMGSSIGIASGLVLAGVSDPVVAVVGDSDFFHLGVNALFNVAHQGTDLLVIILDNGTTALSGFQPVPGHSSNGVKEDRTLSIEGVAGACHADYMEVIDPWNHREAKKHLQKALSGKGLRVLVSRGLCPYIDNGVCPGYQADVNQ